VARLESPRGFCLRGTIGMSIRLLPNAALLVIAL
jgi:hypothetical protein